MAQGAVQAIEDAVILARCLSSEADKLAALQRYFEARIDRVTKIQRRSAANVDLFHKRGAVAQLASYAPIWAAARLTPNLIHARQDAIYGYDPVTAAL